MNYRVPGFEMDDDYASPSVSRPRKATLEDDGIMELLWQNGQVVMQSQKSIKKSAAAYTDFADEFIRADDSGRREIHDQSNHQQQQNLFIQEDEMASWLNYPLNDFCSDFLYSSALPCVNDTATEMEAPTTTATTAATAIATASPVRADRPAAPSKAKVAQRPPIPPPSRRVDNFEYWSSLSSKARVDESGPSSSNRAVVDSNETPAVPPQSRISEAANSEISAHGTTASLAATAAAATSSGAGTEIAACEMTLMSSPSASSASAEPMTAKRSPPPQAPPPPKDRKRKGRELDDADCNSEDIELDSPDGKKHVRGSISIKKSRAAEVHNLSERRRRDRINEKMKALQELIPHCNKADKASMLDEAIEYLKSLQLQVQMMSMGCRMVPMMFPGVQQCMPHPHLAAMSMGMGMGMGMNRPMMPFPGVIPTAAVGGPHPVPRFPMPPPFHMMQQHSAGADPSRIPPNTNSHYHHPADSMMGGSFVMQNHPNHPHIPNFVDPYQQYLRLHHMQFPQPQNQSVEHGDSSKCSASKGGAAAENLQNHPSG